MRPKLGVLGVPSSIGSHYAGQEKAPGALRAAGLVDRLQNEGFEVADFGDLPVTPYKPGSLNRKQQNLEGVVSVVRQTADLVFRVTSEGFFPVVLGGDCTITIGVLSGLIRHAGTKGLLYFDGDVDLGTPETSQSGVLDSMGISHILGRGVPELSHIGPSVPLLSEERVVLFGFDPAEVSPPTAELLRRSKMPQYPANLVVVYPAKFAREAHQLLENRVDGFLLHFDVDVIDSADLPLANFPHHNEGLPYATAIECLSEFLSSAKCRGLVLTELNPDHDPEGDLVRTFTRLLVLAMKRIPG